MRVSKQLSFATWSYTAPDTRREYEILTHDACTIKNSKKHAISAYLDTLDLTRLLGWAHLYNRYNTCPNVAVKSDRFDSAKYTKRLSILSIHTLTLASNT